MSLNFTSVNTTFKLHIVVALNVSDKFELFELLL